MLDPRLAFLRPNFPLKVQPSLNRRTCEITFKVKLATEDRNPGQAHLFAAAAEYIAALGAILNRHEQAAARTLRTDKTIKAWEKRKDAVRRAYRKLRGLGVAHRAAVRAVSDQPAFDDLRNAHNWTRSDFSHCIASSSLYRPSVAPGPKSVPIRAIPVLIPKRAKRTLAGARRMMGGNPS